MSDRRASEETTSGRGQAPAADAQPSADQAEAALQQRACAAAADWIAVANAWAGVRIAMPVLRFDLRGRAAGLAVYPRSRRHRASIRLNAALLRDHPREMIEQTVPHEVAHVVTRWLYGDRAKAHGREWRGVMHAFGKKPAVCHALPTVAARRMAYYPYRCACPEPRQLSAVRHRRVLAGRSSYRCIQCGANLAYTGGAASR